MIAKRLSAILVAGLPLVYAACGGGDLTLPSEGEPATIAVLSGDGQNGRVGTQLIAPLVVKVTDTQSRPVAGATVNFVFDDVSAASAAPATTGANGEASGSITLGSRVGAITGHATVPVPAGRVPVTIAFTATAVPSDANGIAYVSGNDQTGAVGTPLALPLVVQVSDAFGNPIAGVAVSWSVPGGGSVSESPTQTGDNGQTSVTWTLGNTAGPQTALASVEGLVGSPVTFNATATAGSAERVEIVSGNDQSGAPGTQLSLPLVVRVLDAQSNPIIGRAVTWVPGTTSGTVTPQTSNTDAQGHASTQWTLPSAPPGDYTVTAVVSGAGTARFIGHVTSGSPSASTSTVSASPTTISAGSGTSTITVRVRDANGSSLSGVSVTLAASGTGNTIDPASALTNDNGTATFSFRSTVGESKTITATAGGVQLSQQPTITVEKVRPDLRIRSDKPDPSIVGEDVTVVFTVTSGSGTPTGNVTVTAEGGPESCSGTVAAGSCVIKFLAPGDNRRLTATYPGDETFMGDTDTEDHRVNPAPVANQPPVATDDAYATSAGVGFHVPGATGFSLIFNDTDPDFDDLFTVPGTFATTAGGSVVVGNDGSFDYTPPPGQLPGTTDSFTYTLTDREPGTGGLTDTGNVTITIN